MADDQTFTGISNRATPAEEEVERQEFPPRRDGSSPPNDAAGSTAAEPPVDVGSGQTARKAGSRSVAQKESESKYADRSMPQTHPVPGAFGKERPEES